MKLIRIMLWWLIALKAVEVAVAFYQGEWHYGINNILFAMLVFCLILAYKENENKDKLIGQMGTTLKDIVWRVSRDNMQEYIESVESNRGEYTYMMRPNGFLVYFQPDIYSIIPIKFIPFEDDKEYAWICTDELIEKLNEK